MMLLMLMLMGLMLRLLLLLLSLPQHCHKEAAGILIMRKNAKTAPQLHGDGLLHR